MMIDDEKYMRKINNADDNFLQSSGSGSGSGKSQKKISGFFQGASAYKTDRNCDENFMEQTAVEDDKLEEGADNKENIQTT